MEPIGANLLCGACKLLKRWSGRPDSNRRRPAWEAGILPLNYSRLPYFSSTYLFSKDLGRSTASLFRLLRPSKTMGFDRKMDSKVDSKPVWEASPPPFSFTVHFTVHPTTDSTYNTGRPPGRTRSPTWRRKSALTKRSWSPEYPDWVKCVPAKLGQSGLNYPGDEHIQATWTAVKEQTAGPRFEG